MVKSCSAIGCTNRSRKGSGINFYRFPVEPEKRSQWIAALRRESWIPKKNSWLCCKHFISGKKSDDPLSPDFVPSMFTFVSTPTKRKQQEKLSSYERRKKRRKLFPSSSTSNLKSTQRSEENLDGGEGAELNDQEGLNTFSERSDLEGPDFLPPDYSASDELRQHVVDAHEFAVLQRENVLLQQQISHLREENKQLTTNNVLLQHRVTDLLAENKQLKASNVLSEDSLMCDDDSVKLYTGLPTFAVLMVVFEFVTRGMVDHHRSKLSKFSQFLLVLMKLRLNLLDADLARRFGVSQSTVSKLIMKWINVMYVCLQPLIIWPEREDVCATMPKECSQFFKRCISIIDCFEVFCERPSGLMGRAQTFSNYKHHNTVKFLISITPQGVISFISKGWGGRTSDKHLTEHCGILKKLLPGDQIMADRGFTIHESVGSFGAELIIPPFTRGKAQLSQTEIDKARQLSRVRIHVERVIGLLRNKYMCLQATVPIAHLMHDDGDKTACALDKIVNICCALCNCCESVVPLK